jgi:hypothetical protein
MPLDPRLGNLSFPGVPGRESQIQQQRRGSQTQEKALSRSILSTRCALCGKQSTPTEFGLCPSCDEEQQRRIEAHDNNIPLRTEERNLVEAIGNLFKSGNEDVLGLVHKDEETSHHFEKQWNTIEEMFALKVIKSPFHEELTSAFRDIHSYKYVDDSTFPIALRKRLTARGIPTEEIVNAEKHLQEICEELKKENFQEKAAGWNPNLDQIIDLTKNANNRKPSQEAPFTGGGPAPDPNEIA